MNIVLINHATGNPEIGPNMRHFRLLSELKKSYNQYKITILGSRTFHKYHKTPKKKSSINKIDYIYFNNINYKIFFNQVINQHLFGISVFWWIIKNRNKPIDTVYFSSPPPISFIFGYIALKLINKKTKLIFEYRDLWPEILLELKNSFFIKVYSKYISFIVKLAYKNCNKIICVKEGEVDYLYTKYFVPKDNTVWIPNGIDTDIEKPLLKYTLIGEHKDFNIVYVGAMSNYYNLDFVIKAIYEQNINFCNFHFFGTGSHLKKLKEMITDYKLNNVFFHGYIESKYLPAILQKCDVGLLPLQDVKSNKYGISTNKIFEYIKYKTPVIGIYNSIYDPIKKYDIGINVGYNSKLFKNALIKLKKDNISAYRNNFDSALKIHSTKNLAIKLHETLQSL